MKMKKEIENLRNERFVSRAAVVKSDIIDVKNRTIRTVLATETPAEVFDWERWEVVREILMITDDSVMLPDNRQVPLVDTHVRSSVEKLKGSIRNLRIEGNELIGETQFSSLAEDEWTKAREGHLTDVSVGYRTFPENTIVLAPGETANVGGREIRNDFPDKKTLLIRTKWQPKEGSLVIVGADPKAQFRSYFESETEKTTMLGDLKNEIISELQKQRTEIEEKIKHITFQGEKKMEEPKNTLTPEEIRKQELERIREIEALSQRFFGKAPNLKEEAQKAIQEGKSIDEFRNYILDNLDASQPVETPKTQIGMSKKEIQEFSISRAILAAASGDWNIAPGEREAIKATAEALGREWNDKKILLPREVQLRGARTLYSGSTDGQYVVGTDLRGDEFIEYLRAKTVLGQAGMTILTGLKDNIAIPKQDGAVSITMVAEGSAATAADLSLTQLSASPKTATANTSYSRKLLLQSNPSIDSLVMTDLYRQMDIKRDYMGLHGDGVAPNPTGVANTTGVGSVDMSLAVDWSKIVSFETDIETANADTPSLKWIANPAVKGKLKTTLKASNTGFFLWENNEMNGYPALWSSNVAAQHLFFGDWSQLMFLEWGVVEIIVDPYTHSTSGIIDVTILDEFDFIVRQPGAFAVSINVAV